VSRQGGIRDGKRGDVRTIRRGWMLQTVLLSQWYGSRTIAFCHEQNFYALWYLLCTVVLAVSLLYSLWTVGLLGARNRVLWTVGLLGARNRVFWTVAFDQGRHRVAGGFGHGGPGYP
jgi:hypothetical protein